MKTLKKNKQPTVVLVKWNKQFEDTKDNVGFQNTDG